MRLKTKICCAGLSILLAACGSGSGGSGNNVATVAPSSDTDLLPTLAAQSVSTIALPSVATTAPTDVPSEAPKVDISVAATENTTPTTDQTNGIAGTAAQIETGNELAGELPVPPALPPSLAELANHCAVPRTGVNPLTGSPYPDVQGTLTDEMNWIAAFSQDTYLWYKDLPVPTVSTAPYHVSANVTVTNPANNVPKIQTLQSNFDVVSAYFNTQRTTAWNAALNQPVDRLHFTAETATTINDANNNKIVVPPNVTFGFGFQLIEGSNSNGRTFTVAYTTVGSPASPNFPRGTQILAVNHMNLNSEPVSPDADPATELTSPSLKPYVLTVQVPSETSPRDIDITPNGFQDHTVPEINLLSYSALGYAVGYIAVTDFVPMTELNLKASFQVLQKYNISDLVLDLRYNTGGELDIASELAYIIAGAQPDNTPFVTLTGNDKYLPVQSTIPFLDRAIYFCDRDPNNGQCKCDPENTTACKPIGMPQTALNLKTVYIITGPATCSASESLINGLRGVGVNVVLIGEPTCGKPVASIPEDNCGTTYYTAQFKTSNAEGFSDFEAGFIPTPGATGLGNVLPGCVVADDLTMPLGDSNEPALKAALNYIQQEKFGGPGAGSCPAQAASHKSANQQSHLLRRAERSIGLISRPQQ